jgi:hypothetical protein
MMVSLLRAESIRKVNRRASVAWMRLAIVKTLRTFVVEKSAVRADPTFSASSGYPLNAIQRDIREH